MKPREKIRQVVSDQQGKKGGVKVVKGMLMGVVLIALLMLGGMGALMLLPMTTEMREACDIDFNGVCDNKDRAII